MPRFVIKELLETLHRKLKEQAARHHRSMTKELVVLEQAPQSETPAPFRGRFPLTDKFLDKARREGRE